MEKQKQTPSAVFHVNERGGDVYFRVNRPLELLDAAAGVCAHNAMKRSLRVSDSRITMQARSRA